MKKSVVAVIQAGFWICYFLLIAIALGLYYRSNHDASRVTNAFYTLLLFAFFPSVFCFYSFYFYLFPRYLQNRKIVQTIVMAIVMAVTIATLGYVLMRYFIESGLVVDMDNGGKYGRSKAPTVVLMMALIGLLCGGIALIIKGFITWFEEIKVKEALREKNFAMEMMLIKKQLDPHLFFNTINNIDSLILRDAVAASEYLNKLSDIIRFVLYETRLEKIMLSKEIEYIEKYIALQKIRTANEDYVQLTITGSAAGKLIAPIIFIPFIENAFKHSTNKKIESAISIQLHVKDDYTEFICVNKYDTKAVKQSTEGIGNELIQKRLSLIYPQKHVLKIEKDIEFYRVNLIIHHG